MNWWVRCALWASLFALPCWWISAPYQHGLARIAEFVLGLGGADIAIDDIDLFAPWDLAIFVAMCLATFRAPWSARVRALWIGGAALVTIEVAMIVLGVVVLMRPAGASAGPADGAMVSHVFATVPWVAAGLVWIPLLGHYQLTGGAFAAAANPRPAKRTKL
jgi:hypothetical protein